MEVAKKFPNETGWFSELWTCGYFGFIFFSNFQKFHNVFTLNRVSINDLLTMG